jgi:hypothetical protein
MREGSMLTHLVGVVEMHLGRRHGSGRFDIY